MLPAYGKRINGRGRKTGEEESCKENAEKECLGVFYMNWYKIRYTPTEASDLGSQNFVRFFMQQIDKNILVISEFGKKHKVFHYHVCIQSHLAESQLRKNLVNAVGCVGSKNRPPETKNTYTLGAVKSTGEDLRAYEQYLCKSDSKTSIGPTIHVQRGKYTTEYIMDCFQAYWKYGGPKSEHNIVPLGTMEPYVQVVHHVHDKPPRKKKPTFNEDVLAQLQLEYPDKQWCLTDMPLVLNKVVRMHGKCIKNFGIDQIEKECYAIMTHLDPDAMVNEIYEQIANRGNLPGITRSRFS